jgi:hypothetical protein
MAEPADHCRSGGVERPPLSQATIAAPDPVWGGGPDGPALLDAAGLRPAHLVGTFDTDEAQALLLAAKPTSPCCTRLNWSADWRPSRRSVWK